MGHLYSQPNVPRVYTLVNAGIVQEGDERLQDLMR